MASRRAYRRGQKRSTGCNAASPEAATKSARCQTLRREASCRPKPAGEKLLQVDISATANDQANPLVRMFAFFDVGSDPFMAKRALSIAVLPHCTRAMPLPLHRVRSHAQTTFEC